MSKKHVAVYVRVSSKQQDHRSQLPDLERNVEATDEPIKWYKDKFTGRTMDRPGWNKLEADMRAGKISKIIVWRLDRLGRDVAGLSNLYKDLQARKINLVSLRDGFDLFTPAGRLVAHILASVAQYETELKGERVSAGQAVARSKGKTWGGSKPGVRKKVSPTQIKAIKAMRADGEQITAIAKAVGLSRPTIYDVLKGV